MASHIPITPIDGRVTVSVRTLRLGESRAAPEPREGAHPPVTHVPRADVDKSRLVRTERTATCPWKGRANSCSVRGEGGLIENAVRTCEDPRADAVAIAGHLAFCPGVTVTRG
ncbi:MAG: DUF427 domain-containing protein [Tabrizicola sp.]